MNHLKSAIGAAAYLTGVTNRSGPYMIRTTEQIKHAWFCLETNFDIIQAVYEVATQQPADEDQSKNFRFHWASSAINSTNNPTASSWLHLPKLGIVAGATLGAAGGSALALAGLCTGYYRSLKKCVSAAISAAALGSAVGYDFMRLNREQIAQKMAVRKAKVEEFLRQEIETRALEQSEANTTNHELANQAT